MLGTTPKKIYVSSLIEHRLPLSHLLAHVFRPPQTVLEDYPGVLLLPGTAVLKLDTETQALQVCPATSIRGQSHPVNIRRGIRFLTSEQLLFTNFTCFNMLPLIPRPTAPQINATPITNLTDSISHVSTLLFSLLFSSCSTNESHSFILSSPTNQGYKSLPLLTDPSSLSSPLVAAK